MAKHEELAKEWDAVEPGDRVRWATPRFIKIGTVITRRGRSMKVAFDGEYRDTILPDGQWYFEQWLYHHNKEEHLVVVRAPNPTRTKLKEPEVGVDMMNVREAAVLFGVSAKDIRRWLRAGRVIGGRANDQTWQVDSVSLGQHLAKR